jgi:hypothetical protein
MPTTAPTRIDATVPSPGTAPIIDGASTTPATTPLPNRTLTTDKNAPVATSVGVISSAAPVVASPATSPAILEIEVDHKFAEAKLSVWVDDRLTYTHPLEGVDKKYLVVFHRMQGHELHAMQIAPGTHRLRVRVTSHAAGYDQSATLTGEFVSKHDNLVEVTFDKHGDMNLSLQ